MAKYRNSILEYWTTHSRGTHTPSNGSRPATLVRPVQSTSCPTTTPCGAGFSLARRCSSPRLLLRSAPCSLKLFFPGARATTLHDQVEASLMAAFNKRQPRLVSAQNAAVLGGAEAGAGPRPRVQGQRHDTRTRVPGHEPCRPLKPPLRAGASATPKPKEGVRLPIRIHPHLVVDGPLVFWCCHVI